MTDVDRKKLDGALDTFENFMDFVKFANDHDIVFHLEEWEEYRDEVLRRVKPPSERHIRVDTSGLILPM